MSPERPNDRRAATPLLSFIENLKSLCANDVGEELKGECTVFVFRTDSELAAKQR